jgi:hypothetical protein
MSQGLGEVRISFQMRMIHYGSIRLYSNGPHRCRTNNNMVVTQTGNLSMGFELEALYDSDLPLPQLHPSSTPSS